MSSPFTSCNIISDGNASIIRIQYYNIYIINICKINTFKYILMPKLNTCTKSKIKYTVILLLNKRCEYLFHHCLNCDRRTDYVLQRSTAPLVVNSGMTPVNEWLSTYGMVKHFQSSPWWNHNQRKCHSKAYVCRERYDFTTAHWVDLKCMN